MSINCIILPSILKQPPTLLERRSSFQEPQVFADLLQIVPTITHLLDRLFRRG